MSSLRQLTIANDVIKLKQYTTINLLEYFSYNSEVRAVTCELNLN